MRYYQRWIPLGLKGNWRSYKYRFILYKCFWRREWQPTLIFLPGESHGQRSLVGYLQRVGHDWATRQRTARTTPPLNMLKSLWGVAFPISGPASSSTSKPLFTKLPAPPPQNHTHPLQSCLRHFTQTASAKAPLSLTQQQACLVISRQYRKTQFIFYKTQSWNKIYTNILKSIKTNLIHTFGFKHKLDSKFFHFLRPLLLENLIGKT